MSLSEVLDEIKGDAEEVDESLVLDSNKGIEGKVAVEEFKLFPVELTRVNPTTLEAYNKAYDLKVLKETIGEHTKVDKGIVLEAMAALPEVSHVSQAKLTTAPSAINKKILDDIIYSGVDKVPSDLIDAIRGLYEELLVRENVTSGLMNEVEGRYIEIETLIQEKGLEDSELELVTLPNHEQYMELVESFSVFSELLNIENKVWRIKGKELLSLLGDVKMHVRANLNTIEEFKTDAKLYLEGTPDNLSGELNNVVRNMGSAYDAIEGLNKISRIVSGEGCSMEVIQEFLDKA